DVTIMGLGYGDTLRITVPRKNLEIEARFLRSYGFAKEGETLALINSEGFLELSVNRGSFASRYGIEEGDEVVISIVK
ncbi:MAG: SAM hydroxide adenosyltransferase, partial [Vulcanisaeta sp.]|nr:SAM hydroxide adenosyltransferase [Vulcanisaeta sp.]